MLTHASHHLALECVSLALDCVSFPLNLERFTVGLFIGPEGGFTEQEVQLVCANGGLALSLGKRILRTETAAVAAASVIMYELGQME